MNRGYSKTNRIRILHSIVNSIKKTRPDEDIYIDKENVKIVWGKPSGQESSIDKYKKCYPWL